MLVLCKCMFIIIEAIQNNEKHCDIYFDQALGALLCLVCCDQGSTAHVCCCCCYQCLLCVLLTVSYEYHFKHSPYIQESLYSIIVSLCNTDYNMVSENRVKNYSSEVQCANGASLEANS